MVGVSVAGRAHVAGKVGASEAAARELGIGKPIELLVRKSGQVAIRTRKRRYLPCLDDARPMTTERGDENGS